MPSRIGIAKPGFVKGRALGKVELAEAPKWLLDQCARQVARVLKVDEIKIADVLIGENRRSLNPEKVAEIADSIATIGQTSPITVRRKEDGKLVLVDGLHRLRATESLGRTHIRAEIMEGDDIEARLWEIAALLHRANLTALEEAERVAEWVRLTEGREPVSGQKVQKPKGGRPQSGVAKAARQLPVKGKNLRRTPEADRTRNQNCCHLVGGQGGHQEGRTGRASLGSLSDCPPEKPEGAGRQGSRDCSPQGWSAAETHARHTRRGHVGGQASCGPPRPPQAASRWTYQPAAARRRCRR